MNRAIVLESYEASWPRDDPDAGFRQMVAEYSHLDPLPTLEALSRSKGIPVGALARCVLTRYCTSGSDALLEMGPRVVQQMDDVVQKAEVAGTDAARLEAYGALRAIISWLKVPLEPGQRYRPLRSSWRLVRRCLATRLGTGYRAIGRLPGGSNPAPVRPSTCSWPSGPLPRVPSSAGTSPRRYRRANLTHP